jgi:hypothetical protein
MTVDYSTLQPHVAKKPRKRDGPVRGFEPLEWRVVARAVPLRVRSYVVAARLPLFRWWGVVR